MMLFLSTNYHLILPADPLRKHEIFDLRLKKDMLQGTCLHCKPVQASAISQWHAGAALPPCLHGGQERALTLLIQ